MPGRGRRRGPASGHVPSVADRHAEWLGLLRPDGPFLTLSVLTETFSQGLATVPDATRARLRQAWGEVSAEPGVLGPAWQNLVLTELLGYQAALLDEGSVLKTGAGGVRPDSIVYGPNLGGGRSARLLIYRRGFGENLTSTPRGEPALTERAAQMCRETDCPLALLTNGRLWLLVHAKPGAATAVASFDADLWFEEPALLAGFVALLSMSRVLPPEFDRQGGPSTSLAGLFVRSANARSQVTSTLGGQVRQAVELFVGELARLDRETRGALLGPISERDIYRASLTVLMRLVFLLYAEEQRLLPVTDPVYANGYAVSTLFDQLSEERDMYGDEIGDRRAAAWPRLLALFAAIHGGSEHPDLRIPAHGGSLFDPAQFVWLAEAQVTDRVVYEILEALLILKHRGHAPERLSYRGLDVEQIGHVYEGLLEFSCRKVDEPYLGLIGKLEPEIPLSEVAAAAQQSPDQFGAWLRERCDLTPSRLAKALGAQATIDQLGALHAACDNDAELAEQVIPFMGLVRTDLRGMPTVFPAGSVLFTQVGDRRATGTHYTPRSLADEVVEHTLAPLCFAPGPADGAERADWQVKPAEDLFKLKVADPAMGSGAFLVSACRYLAERVAQAWERDRVPDDVAFLLNTGEDREGLLLAARRYVATRCLYGVDRDDMAVELAKLSLWLVTLAKNKPFGFVDHALRCGDSLVGLVSRDQLVAFHLDPAQGWNVGTDLFRTLNETIDAGLAEATELRQRIELTVVEDQRDAEEKAALLARAESLTERLRLAADGVVGAGLSTAVRNAPWYEEDDDPNIDDRLRDIADDTDRMLRDGDDSPMEQTLRRTIATWLRGPRSQPIHPFHWALEFPEVMSRGGFDAIVGNPPFIGGQRLTGSVGRDVREYLVEHLGGGKRGSADLCSYFLLRDVDITFGGRIGIIATNTIAQGDTREVGLDQIAARGRKIYRATKSRPWPGTATLEVSLVWVGPAGKHEAVNLDGLPVRAITTSLDSESRVTGNPHRLVANGNQSFIGSYVLGTGFILDPTQAQDLIAKDQRNREVLFPYLNGEDLNTEPDCSASRQIINFHDWHIDRAREYPECFTIVETTVKPERLQNNYSKSARERWWQYERRRPELYGAVAGLDRVLAMARTSSTGIATFVTPNQVLNENVVVFASRRSGILTMLNSQIHVSWAWQYSGTLRSDLQYKPSDCFQTYPQPALTPHMDMIGEELHEFRQIVMLRRDLGLTKLYNQVHSPIEITQEIRRLREIHIEVDRAVAEAYGWTDLELGHGFYETRQGKRFTIDPAIQVEILDRLLELNHARHAEEVANGLLGKKNTARRAKTVPLSADPTIFDDGSLFAPDDTMF